MSAFVVDVNVAIVANGNESPQANLACMSACVSALQDIVANGMVVLDDGMRILKEYQRYLSPAGQPGLGDAFMRWVWENQCVAEKCERVALTLIGGVEDKFHQFPKDANLKGFDRSDRKYVAVALTSQKNPEILNAVDTDYWNHRIALRKNGVRLRFLCPQNMQKFNRKSVKTK